MTYQPYVPPPAKKFSFTQPVCTNCWIEDNTSAEGIRIPIRLKAAEREWGDLLEQCCKCGRMTTAQIFIRVDPATVLHPTHEKD